MKSSSNVVHLTPEHSRNQSGPARPSAVKDKSQLSEMAQEVIRLSGFMGFPDDTPKTNRFELTPDMCVYTIATALYTGSLRHHWHQETGRTRTVWSSFTAYLNAVYPEVLSAEDRARLNISNKTLIEARRVVLELMLWEEVLLSTQQESAPEDIVEGGLEKFARVTASIIWPLLRFGIALLPGYYSRGRR